MKNKWILKGVAYTVALDAVICAVMLLCLQKCIKDEIFLFLLLGIYVLAAPLYFAVKGDAPKPLLYPLVPLLTHLAVSALTVIVLNVVYGGGWSMVGVVWTEISAAVFWAVILLYDVVYCLLRVKR